ncbi:zinc-dependent alcohol dehydrogenase [Nesterenkonia lutea]|uniref:Threonine dehydrogenase-like Zn-dependent dehydrogenase n=1 Tax=Nesterenkonia lutea TaxID=272919 RepID=A0ABR9JFB5_9MICC|nr:zinc-binding alcohol dehydrogenase [Nesterenkonia lutea]MBE1524458.1 threonine dehydrogenase-like Zn-dependent dehydrogenase [Nesterenkonia lutea]
MSESSVTDVSPDLAGEPDPGPPELPRTSRQYWTEAAHTGALREVRLPRPGPGEVLIETLHSGISRGTESVVHRGEVPASITAIMQAPFQLGELPFPVSHGYLNVGVVRQGSQALLGQTVFTLAGHREHVVVPEADCHVLPEDCPTERALFAGIGEVGLNALWEAPVLAGDRVAVVGGGLIGLTTALFASKLPLERLQVIEVDADRRALIGSLGLEAVSPEKAATDNDVVLHSSASSAGLATALKIAGDDAVIVEQSWYGTGDQQVPLGADFHARRLRIVATQVGEVPGPRRMRRSRGQRLAAALRMLDPRFDTLISGRSTLQELPTVMADVAGSAPWTREQILHVIDHPLTAHHAFG